jgi:hypothetical protein
MDGNDSITTTHASFGRSSRANPYARNTPEWAAWEAGFAAGATQRNTRGVFYAH